MNTKERSFALVTIADLSLAVMAMAFGFAIYTRKVGVERSPFEFDLFSVSCGCWILWPLIACKQFVVQRREEALRVGELLWAALAFWGLLLEISSWARTDELSLMLLIVIGPLFHLIVMTTGVVYVVRCCARRAPRPPLWSDSVGCVIAVVLPRSFLSAFRQLHWISHISARSARNHLRSDLVTRRA